MRKHGWQLPYHPLQVVAVAVFLALGFAFYVFFAPFVGKRMFQYIVMALYTPLIICSFSLYIWCAAADPADPGVFKSKKYLNVPDSKKHTLLKESKLGRESISSIQDTNASPVGEKSVDPGLKGKDTSKGDCAAEIEKKIVSSDQSSCFMPLLVFIPCAFMPCCSSPHEESAEQQMSEDGMFYCGLCKVEVFKYSKHCRVCDKCVDRFDHHCRWLNNCIGKKNYRQFFTLMVSAILLLVLQWSTGILVLISCFLERRRFSMDISSKLGSSFSIVPFVIVVAMCTILAMIATLPLAQLFFFHILLLKKGITTYDYIIALREQEQQGIGGQQSPQMSPASSLTGLSSTSSFNTFHRGAWCTPPRLFLEEQFDVVPPDTGSVSSLGKKIVGEEPIKKKNPAPVKISPWTLARLNAEEVTKAAAEARKKSKILQPVVKQEVSFGLETDSSFGGSSSRRMIPRPDSNNKRRASKRIRLPAESLETLRKFSAKAADGNGSDPISGTSTSLLPLQIEARKAFQASLTVPGSAGVVASSPESSLDSPDLHPFEVSSSGAEEARQLTGVLAATAADRGILLSRSTSDGYEASGGEDSDQVPSRTGQRSMNWGNRPFNSTQNDRDARFKAPSACSQASNWKL